jgi:hypothetical protein
MTNRNLTSSKFDSEKYRKEMEKYEFEIKEMEKESREKGKYKEYKEYKEYKIWSCTNSHHYQDDDESCIQCSIDEMKRNKI